MEKSNIKALRDFIKAHEMRYYVSVGNIKKAFRVDLNDGQHWLHFAYGVRPELLSPQEVKNRLFSTMKEAKAKAEELRKERKKKNDAKRKAKKEEFEKVTNYLLNFAVWDIQEYDNEREEYVIKPEGEMFVEAIKHLYDSLPKNAKDDKDTYISVLEQYIKYGTILTQGMAFRKEQIVRIKYGCDDSVKIFLTDGTSIIPKSRAVTQLIKLIFSECSQWSFNKIKFPEGKYDTIEERDS